MNAIKAVGDSPVVQGIGQAMKVISDVKEVAGTVVGAFLGPVAKTALKVSNISRMQLARIISLL